MIPDYLSIFTCIQKCAGSGTRTYRNAICLLARGFGKNAQIYRVLRTQRIRRGLISAHTQKEMIYILLFSTQTVYKWLVLCKLAWSQCVLTQREVPSDCSYSSVLSITLSFRCAYPVQLSSYRALWMPSWCSPNQRIAAVIPLPHVFVAAGSPAELACRNLSRASIPPTESPIVRHRSVCCLRTV